MKAVLENYRRIFEIQLNNYLENYGTKIRPVFDAVKYAVADGGKRIRPALCYMTAEFCGRSPHDVSNLALGIEMIHSYSLVHDDLPCMDDDALRRGKPAVHKAFGEGMAVLAGDALLNLAFEALLSDASEENIRAVRCVARYAGLSGMVGGQCMDLGNDGGAQPTLEQLARINALKTGALFKASICAPAIKCGADERTLTALTAYAERLGAVFQIVDDILDVVSDSATVGKETGRDAANDKRTYVTILGIDGAKAYAKKTEQDAIEALDGLENSAPLAELCRFLTNRID